MTIVVVARPDALEPSTRLWDFHDGGASEIALAVSSTGALSFINGATAVAANAGAAWGVGTWCHVVLSLRVGGTALIYINGALSATLGRARPAQRAPTRLFPLVALLSYHFTHTVFPRATVGTVPSVSRMGFLGRGPATVTGSSDPWFQGEIANFQARGTPRHATPRHLPRYLLRHPPRHPPRLRGSRELMRRASTLLPFSARLPPSAVLPAGSERGRHRRDLRWEHFGLPARAQARGCSGCGGHCVACPPVLRCSASALLPGWMRGGTE